MELIKPDININIVGKMKVAAIFSLILIIISIVSLILHGGPRLGIDFSGGTLVQLQFKKETTVDRIRSGLKKISLEKSVIQQFGYKDNNEFLIRTEKSTSDAKGLSGELEDVLDVTYGKGNFEVRRVEIVGPKVGKDLRQKGISAMLIAMLGILIYITWRFEFRYAVGAIIALIHDVLITVGIFSLSDKEFTLPIIAALLTIIGYSLNDTIVVFDRIRENIRKTRKQSLREVINSSINQVLSRTILTSVTTLLVVLALFFLGGAVIHNFAFALLVGILAGTYSSVFIASPTVLVWETFKPLIRKRGKK